MPCDAVYNLITLSYKKGKLNIVVEMSSSRSFFMASSLVGLVRLSPFLVLGNVKTASRERERTGSFATAFPMAVV